MDFRGPEVVLVKAAQHGPLRASLPSLSQGCKVAGQAFSVQERRDSPGGTDSFSEETVSHLLPSRRCC